MGTNNSLNNILGPSNSLTMSSQGFMNLPQQPSFFCYLANDITNATGAGASIGVTFDTVLFDKSSNLSNGIFIAPISGVYQFSFAITLLQATLSTSTSLIVYIQTDSGIFTPVSVNPTSIASVLSNLTVSGSVVCHLLAGDFSEIVVTASGLLTNAITIAGSSGPYSTYFSGALLN